MNKVNEWLLHAVWCLITTAAVSAAGGPFQPFKMLHNS
jgi:hypothetical protein